MLLLKNLHQLLISKIIEKYQKTDRKKLNINNNEITQINNRKFQGTKRKPKCN